MIGSKPTAIVELRSYLGEFIKESRGSVGAEDEGPFSMPLLHFRRTIVEKMFAIHAKVQLLKRDCEPLGSYARHYYDLLQPSGEPEVLAMLKSDEYASIKNDYDLVSRSSFREELFSAG